MLGCSNQKKPFSCWVLLWKCSCEWQSSSLPLPLLATLFPKQRWSQDTDPVRCGQRGGEQMTEINFLFPDLCKIAVVCTTGTGSYDRGEDEELPSWSKENKCLLENHTSSLGCLCSRQVQGPPPEATGWTVAQGEL